MKTLETDSARYSYDQVIKMNRKSDRKYVIQSQFRKGQLFLLRDTLE
jgi:hypothetical protein